jgi:catalase
MAVKKGASAPKPNKDAKLQDLELNTSDGTDQFLTTNQGLKINDNQNSLKAGERGATLLEDFILREKITHFDHERIPERIVHARGVGAHGFFELTESLEKVTKAKFLNGVGKRTPIFVRFSTVAGSKGSTDMARDVRGFAVKFYTEEGNYDLVGNNIPVFFIQDAIKFPDLVHAVKPEPHNEIPQAASAHDTFWDFVSLMPESTHMLMWAMSDRAIPRSLRMMEGFGVHTFRFINATGKSTFVKFHFKPTLGMHSVAWDEATKISGKDPDFHRRDLWEAIESGAFPEWQVGVQLVAEEDEHKFEFDLLDPTKIIPEEIVPVRIIGRIVLNRTVDNFFAETEQAAFHPGHIVSGIDFTNDPLLQGRLFSYTDTQLSRLGSPNFHEIPINRSIAPVHNNQRDAHMRQTIDKGRVAYEPNSLAGGCPFQAMISEGGFHSHEERIDAKKVRARSKSFFDHFSQATLFFNSQSEAEQNHIVDAFSFELSKVETEAIRVRMVGNLSMVDKTLAKRVADNLGIAVPKPEVIMNHSFPAGANPKNYQPIKVKSSLDASPALSMANPVNKAKDSAKSRKIAILAAEGVDVKVLSGIQSALLKAGAVPKIIAPKMGFVTDSKGGMTKVDESFLIAASVLFDAVYVAGGAELNQEADAVRFVNEAYRHCKAIGAGGDGVAFVKELTYAGIGDGQDEAVVLGRPAAEFIAAVAAHRNWDREIARKVPA